MTLEQINNHALRFRRFQQSRERFFAPKINNALHQQYLTAAAYAPTFGIYCVNQINSERIARVIKHIYIDAATVYGAKIRADLVKQGATFPNFAPMVIFKSYNTKTRGAIGFSERMMELIEEYFGSDIFSISETITDTTKRIIQNTIIESYRQGVSINEIVKKLESPEITKPRARVIARTETVGSANWAALQVAKDSGILVNKKWMATHDHRTRNDHIHMDGKMVGRDDLFNVSGQLLMVPGDKGGHNGQPSVDPSQYVNCRCTVTFPAVRDAQGRLINVDVTGAISRPFALALIS